jgi:hypothetical protein
MFLRHHDPFLPQWPKRTIDAGNDENLIANSVTLCTVVAVSGETIALESLMLL